MPKRASKVTIDHDEIRRWADKRKGKPAIVRGTGIIRLDFPGFSGADTLQPISWDQWFDRFDASNLALVLEESTARRQQSNFNKLIGRETVDLKSGSLKGPPRRRAKQGARTMTEARGMRATKGTTKRAGATTKRPAKKTAAATKRTATKRAATTAPKKTTMRRPPAKTATTRRKATSSSRRTATGTRRRARA